MRALAALMLVASTCPLSFAQLGDPPTPPGNPVTPEKVQLGKALFWEEQLSSTRTVACGSCHVPSAGMSDPRSALPGARRNPGPDGILGNADDKRGSPGVNHCLLDGSYVKHAHFGLQAKVGTRKAPTTINAAFLRRLFWDGRADQDVFHDPISGAQILGSNATLENLIAEPPVNTFEMAHENRTWVEVVARVQQSAPLALAEDLPPDLASFINARPYSDLFQDAFGSPGIDASRIIMAIASYLRTLVSDQTPFDAFLNGDNSALTQEQQLGFGTFTRTCIVCHSLPLLSDDDFHNTGVRPPDEDRGRAEVTGDPADDAMFRTPSLRNVGLREPLFHHGRMNDLEAVVRFYDRGGDFPQDAFSDPLVDPLGLTQTDRRNLVDFLRNALTDPRVAAEAPPFDRPKLYTESDRVPEVLAAGTAGSGGFVPRMIATEPPMIGNPSLSFGLERALGGAPALVLATLTTPQGSVVIPFVHGTLADSGPGEGWASRSIAVPDDPILQGVLLDAQWLVLDPAAAKKLARSELVRFRFF